MRLLFVADGRSPIALNWIRHFVDRGDEVHLATSFPASPAFPLASYVDISLAFSRARRSDGQPGKTQAQKGAIWGSASIQFRTALRQWLGPLTMPGAARQLKAYIKEVKPDLVHAMRIPYEGMAAALAFSSANSRLTPPLLVSTWGNDFTYHAVSTPLMGYFTRRCVQRADALHTDCQRDQRLARNWGFPAQRPCIVLPGGGGIRMDIFHPRARNHSITTGQTWIHPAGGWKQPTIINPRGFRAYVRNDTFFQAIPIILESQPTARFICSNMAGEQQAERWVQQFNIAQAVDLLPNQTHPEMADLYRQSQVSVSPSSHDGTPNTLLESMASGCFPIAGDIESLREWIEPGVNGLLVDPGNPRALANAILYVLEQPAMQARAATHNYRLINERAEYGRVMREAEAFYRLVVEEIR